MLNFVARFEDGSTISLALPYHGRGFVAAVNHAHRLFLAHAHLNGVRLNGYDLIR